MRTCPNNTDDNDDDGRMTSYDQEYNLEAMMLAGPGPRAGGAEGEQEGQRDTPLPS